jgi:hypothetical protein
MIRHRKNQGALTKAAPYSTRLPSAGQQSPVVRSSVFFILRLDPHKYAVAVWRRVEEAEPVYEIVHENVRTSA